MLQVLLLVGLSLSQAITRPREKLKTTPNALSFSMVADWGGIDEPPYQRLWGYHVAESMDRMVDIAKTQYLLLVGDNFYEDGVQNVTDPRFEQTFQKTFNPNLKNLVDMSMWIQSGNHDYHANVTAQIEYSKTDKRWNYPKLWYKMPPSVYTGFSIDILMIDTNLLVGLNCTDQTIEQAAELRIQQYNWIQSEVEASTADYLIVVGHHTIESIAKHGPDAELIENLLPILKSGKVNFYLCGHDHQMQALSEEYVAADGTTNKFNYIVSGMATKPSASTKNVDNLSEGVTSDFYYSDKESFGAYIQFVVDENEATIYFIDAYDESVVYSVSSGKRML